MCWSRQYRPHSRDSPLVLLCTPALVSVTFTFRVQEPLDPTVPPLRPTEVALAVGENVPPHVLLAFGMPATVMPLGSPSLNVSPLRENAFGLLILKVIVEVPPPECWPHRMP